jgi:hypothetical protein
MGLKLTVDVSAVAAGIACYVLYLTFARTWLWLVRRSKQAEVEQVLEERRVEFVTEPGPEPQPDQETGEGPRKKWYSSPLILFVPILLAFSAAGWEMVRCSNLMLAVPADTLKESAIAPAAKPPAISIPLNRQRMAQTLGNGRLYFKSAYYGTLNLGTPSVPYTFVFDTGSGHLVVPSAYCKSKSCVAHKRYRRSKSTTAVDIEYDGTEVTSGQPRDYVTVEFGTGEIKGVFIEDVMCLDDASLRFLGNATKDTAPNDALSEVPLRPGCVKMRIVAATEMSDEPFQAFKFDGVLGLGLESLSQAPEFNFMKVLSGSLGQWGGAAPSTFGVFLGEGEQEQSELSLGGWDAGHMEDGDVHWNEVHRPELGHWMVRIKALRVDGQIVDFCNEGCKAVMDTGTALMSVPPAAFPELYERLRHPATLDGECRSEGPKLEFELDSVTLTMDPENYARPTPIKKPPSQSFVKSEEDVDDERRYGATRKDMFCKPTLMAMDMPAPVGPKLFILGEPALRKYYTIYDTEAKRVGFGLAHHEREAAATVTHDDDAEDGWWYDES